MKPGHLPSQALCIHQKGAGATAPLREDLTREWNLRQTKELLFLQVRLPRPQDPFKPSSIHINFVGQMAIGERSLRLVKQR